MTTSENKLTILKCSDEIRREIYRVLDITGKISNGQVYVTLRRLNPGPPKGRFPEGTQGRTVELRLKVNNWLICIAQHYVLPDGTFVTEPDPKMIHIDDLVLKQLGIH